MPPRNQRNQPGPESPDPFAALEKFFPSPLSEGFDPLGLNTVEFEPEPDLPPERDHRRT